jgi:uncharacterized membrane protein
MQSSVLLVVIGALLVLSGLLLMAAQAIRKGRMSDARRSPTASATLEPRERISAFGLKANWPGLGLIALGAILLLADAAI